MATLISSQNLRKLINSYGNLSVNELANVMGIPQPTLHRILTGQTTKPKKDVLEKIANYLGLSVITLMEKIAPNDYKLIEIPLFAEINFSPISGFSKAKHFSKIQIETDTNDTGKYIGIQLDNYKQSPFLSCEMILIVNQKTPPLDRSLIALYVKKNNSIIVERLIKEDDNLYIKTKKKNSNEISYQILNEKELILIGVVIEVRFLDSN